MPLPFSHLLRIAHKPPMHPPALVTRIRRSNVVLLGTVYGAMTGTAYGTHRHARPHLPGHGEGRL